MSSNAGVPQELTSSQRFYYCTRRPIPETLKGEFIGLYMIDGKAIQRIIWRAPEKIEDLSFLCHHAAFAPYYVQDPIAWAPLPDIRPGA